MMTGRFTDSARMRERKFYNRLIQAALLGVTLLLSMTVIVHASISNPLLGLTAKQIAAVYGDSQEYAITRNGKPIGTHTLSFRTDDDTLFVNVDSNITVTILRIPVYRLSYTSEEVWRDDVLVSVVATTIENGESSTVKLEELAGDEHSQKPGYASNHWHPGVLTGDAVFNTLTGEFSNITVADLGIEQLDVSGDMVAATHYQYEDDIKANVWYDSAGLWLQMRFAGDDGSIIQYLRI